MRYSEAVYQTDFPTRVRIYPAPFSPTVNAEFSGDASGGTSLPGCGYFYQGGTQVTEIHGDLSVQLLALCSSMVIPPTEARRPQRFTRMITEKLMNENGGEIIGHSNLLLVNIKAGIKKPFANERHFLFKAWG